MQCFVSLLSWSFNTHQASSTDSYSMLFNNYTWTTTNYSSLLLTTTTTLQESKSLLWRLKSLVSMTLLSHDAHQVKSTPDTLCSKSPPTSITVAILTFKEAKEITIKTIQSFSIVLLTPRLKLVLYFMYSKEHAPISEQQNNLVFARYTHKNWCDCKSILFLALPIS